MASEECHCRYLEWDSQFFGCRIGSVAGFGSNPEAGTTIENWSRENKIDCLYLSVDSKNQAEIRIAEDLGFRLVDVRTVLEKDMLRTDWQRATEDVRSARPDDL